MKKIKNKEKLLAVVFGDQLAAGTQPLTDAAYPLQVLGLNHPQGKKLAAHIHEPKNRTTVNLMEVLLVLSGKIKVTVYDDRQPIESVILIEKQAIMTINGGYGIEILEDAKMMEFKNGPYIEDKVLLE